MRPPARTTRAGRSADCRRRGRSPAEVSPNMLTNPPSPTRAADAHGGTGWLGLYAGTGRDQELRLVGTDKGKALRLSDGDPAAEIGITQTVSAKPGLVYEASVQVRGIPGATTEGSYLQMRFVPSQKFAQIDLAPTGTDEFETVATRMLALPDTTQITIYLYTHAQPTPKVLMMNARLVSGVEAPFEVPSPSRPCTTSSRACASPHREGRAAHGRHRLSRPRASTEPRRGRSNRQSEKKPPGRAYRWSPTTRRSRPSPTAATRTSGHRALKTNADHHRQPVNQQGRQRPV